jgi:hypothetical protein
VKLDIPPAYIRQIRVDFVYGDATYTAMIADTDERSRCGYYTAIPIDRETMLNIVDDVKRWATSVVPKEATEDA